MRFQIHLLSTITATSIAIASPSDRSATPASFLHTMALRASLATANWSVDGEHSGYGWSVASAGDVNNDGFDDIIVGAYQYDSERDLGGEAYLYLGSATGPSQTPAWTGGNEQGQSEYGISVDGAGDVNGDGYDDVIVGAHAYHGGDLSNSGRAYVYLGSASGLSQTPAWVVDGDSSDAHFGWSVAGAGDVDGDGYDDVVVGALGYRVHDLDQGRAYLYRGTAGGLFTTPSWTVDGAQFEQRLGSKVAGAGDVNNDGFDDVLVTSSYYTNGQEREGAVFLYLGSTTGLSQTIAWTGEGNQANANYGAGIASAGDVNSDGYDDVIIGASTYDSAATDAGRAFVYYGSSSGLQLAPAWTVDGTQSDEGLGWSVASAGDVNNDGVGDVIVGALRHDGTFTDGGRAAIYLGSNSGLGSEATWVKEGARPEAFYGASVAAAGDVNGDGNVDVLVGSDGHADLYFDAAAGSSSVTENASDHRSTLTIAPNIVSSELRLSFEIDGPSFVDIEIVGVDGRRASTPIARASYEAGRHDLALSVEGMASGVYVMRVRVGSAIMSRTFVVRPD